MTSVFNGWPPILIFSIDVAAVSTFFSVVLTEQISEYERQGRKTTKVIIDNFILKLLRLITKTTANFVLRMYLSKRHANLECHLISAQSH